jgi:uncharacterized protein
MNAWVDYRKKQIDRNRKEFGIYYDQLQKVGYYQAMEKDIERTLLLESLGDKIQYGFNGTKPYTHDISPGCRLCGEGEWSCLFMNNRCNCTCFYCPAPQTNDRLPETQGISFAEPATYIDYLRHFGFKGASISGGEPLLTFETTLAFLTEIKKAFGNRIYLWLYTNGTLLTEERASLLAQTGLDEIRFDLSATSYNTRFLKHAIGKIPHVTVEIPAIPEDVEKLKKAVVALEKLGVNYLNLHQLRLTPHNLSKLLARNYTFLHGPKMTVLESELAALELIRFVLESGLNMPVNYCSFHFKNQFQKAGFRKKFGKVVMLPVEEMTANGFIRKMSISTANGNAENYIRLFTQNNIPETDWHVEDDHQRLLFKENALRHLPVSETPVMIEYFTVQTADQPLENSLPVRMSNNGSLYVQRQRSSERIVIYPDNREALLEIFAGKRNDAINDSDVLLKVVHHEWPASGLADYF